MGRLLIIMALVGVVVWWLLGRSKRVGSGPPTKPDKPQAGAQEMVACAHCGVHLPRADAVSGDARLYCGAEHLRLGPRRP